MHKITLEPKGPYQLWSEDSRTSLQDPDLKCRDHAAVLLDPSHLRKLRDHSAWNVLSLKSAEGHNVVFSRRAISQAIIGGG